ncbi:hypothetical protein NliqN6_3343 [Naganishia liquefaciens]|uniref:Coatomer subunit zeta n=1 Tax=Naganishia liquefaciens TaxID=104408 RepID=A0A8H3TT09_9TREE|nr:hypothetical protein NliqN6_3343 [Naganishia liquefaciens]
MANLSLYTVTALLILDSEGQRVLAKYYNPPHPAPGQHTGGIGTGEGSGLSTLKEQKAFEKSVHEKTKRGGASEVHPLPPHVVISRTSTDLNFHIIGPLATSNEPMLSLALTAFHDAVSMLLRGQVEKRAVLEGLDMVLLAADECIDDGIILETDGTAIASRVSRPKADASDIVINEQTIMNAYSSLKEQMVRRIGQL